MESYFRLNWKLSVGEGVINCVLGEMMREIESTGEGGFRSLNASLQFFEEEREMVDAISLLEYVTFLCLCSC